MSSLKVGMIEYINALQFHFAYANGELQSPVDWHFDVPSNLNRLMDEKKLDASFVSSAYYLEHQSDYVLVESFCIAAEDKVHSVCLYTKTPVEQLSGKQIALTNQSKTSVELLKTLCHRFWKVQPHFKVVDEPEKDSDSDAFLLIGDQSLKHPTFDGYETIDLVEAWQKATNLPFVFAVFVAQKELLDKNPDAINTIRNTIEKSLIWSLHNEDKILDEAKKRTGLDNDRLIPYYQSLRLRMNQRFAKSLGNFGALRYVEGKIHQEQNESNDRPNQ